MQPLKVESKKSFKFGFILNETELRRLVDLVREQTAKIEGHGNTSESYTLKFQNGAVAESNDIDTVFQQENSGSGLIVRLKAEIKGSGDNGDCSTSFEFINADLDDEPGSTSIRFAVLGQDRDWVFVSSSHIKERIDKIKRFAPNQLGEKGPGRFFMRTFMPMFFMLAVLVPALISIKNKQDDLKGAEAPSQVLKKVVAENGITDPIEAIIELERLREKSVLAHDPNMGTFKWLGYAVGILVVGSLVVMFFAKFYPVFNFCWGDYIEAFEKKERTRKFWLIVVVLGIVISFIGGVLANWTKLF